ncbi:serine/threonine protein kinase [Chlamydia caviae]|uniref:Serine/threonine-protein kinase n=1 Tax=Chlamydia caviae (strain ATCC VR-813 / DSM 19441 / 03DC25 / GPIC) TaxID=227941 RepID=Q824V0_CHLCV|nr:serine/threonine-protein kinase [Chlamydia caviae]AAP04791.1 serine/threonine-protein kinase [Chlamydia caviae GPIC]
MDCQSEMLSHNQVIGAYHIKKLLSKKEGSTVYQGVHPDTLQPAAIKVLATPLVTDTPRVHNFLKEARIIEQISHPNIVKLYQYGQCREGLYIAMEYIQGVSLRHYILSQLIPLSRAIDIILHIAQAIEYLHSRGILHRDIKPENILITSQGNIKLIDFGLAISSIDKDARPLYLGTPSYMSPEQRQGDKISELSEIYSLGLIAYELILGNLALGKVVLSLIPDRVSKILAKALQPSPTDRYASMKEFIIDLHRYRHGEDLQKDLRNKDHTAMVNDQLYHQRFWLSPLEIVVPEYLAVSIHEHGYPTHPHVYYEAYMSGDTFRLWFCYSLSGNPTLVLTVMKSFVSQWGHEENIRSTIRKMHSELMRINVPINGKGISLFCVTIPKEKKELSWIACGKTSFRLKKQGKVPEIFTTSSAGLGKISSLQIQETKVAWEIGDGAVLHTLQADDSMSSLHSPLFTELKDRGQTAIFCPIESVRYGIEENHDGNLCPSTLISLKRIR